MAITQVFRLIRLPNLLIVAATGLLILYVTPWLDAAVVTREFITHSLLLVLFMISHAAAGNIINDIYDRSVDEKNKPNKVVVGKSISIRASWWLYVLLSISSFICAIVLTSVTNDWFYLIVFFCYQVLLFLYSKYLQKLPLLGNITVALMIAGVIPVAYRLVQFHTNHISANSLHSYVLIGLTTYAFLVNLLREIIKDAEDITGDKLHGYKTIPILLDNKKLQNLMLLANSLLILCSLLVFGLLMPYFHWTMALLCLVCILLPPVIFTYWSRFMVFHQLIKYLKKGYKIYMLLGLLFYSLFSLTMAL